MRQEHIRGLSSAGRPALRPPGRGDPTSQPQLPFSRGLPRSSWPPTLRRPANPGLPLMVLLLRRPAKPAGLPLLVLQFFVKTAQPLALLFNQRGSVTLSPTRLKASIHTPP